MKKLTGAVAALGMTAIASLSFAQNSAPPRARTAPAPTPQSQLQPQNGLALPERPRNTLAPPERPATTLTPALRTQPAARPVPQDPTRHPGWIGEARGPARR